jgi:hypothetical protein
MPFGKLFCVRAFMLRISDMAVYCVHIRISRCRKYSRLTRVNRFVSDIDSCPCCVLSRCCVLGLYRRALSPAVV